MRIVTWFLMAVMSIGWAGCAEKNASPGGDAAKGAAAAKTNAANAEPAVPGWPPTKAQPKLKTLKLFLGKEVVTAELAMTPVQVGTGMMFRKSMPEEEGMLFIFANPHRTSFYMRNTTVPLTAAYIDPDGAILELVELNPLVETPVEAKSDNVQYVLEMNQGWFKRHNIAVGTVITTEMGKLKETFVPTR